MEPLGQGRKVSTTRRCPLGSLSTMKRALSPTAQNKNRMPILRPQSGFNSEDYRAVEPRSINQDGGIDWSTLERYSADTQSVESHRVKDQDLLVPLHSLKQVAIAVRPPRNVLAVGALATLSPDQEQVTAEYLQIYLNHPNVRARLKRMVIRTTATVPNWKLAELRKFEIEVPELDRQREIIRATQLRKKAEKLQTEINERIDQLLWQAIRS